MASLKKYWFWGIFISILSIFAMSHNAIAMDFNYENYDIFKYVNRGDTTCITLTPETVTGNSFCTFDIPASGPVSVKSIYFTNITTDLKAGDIVELNLIVRNTSNYAISGGAFGLIEAVPRGNMTILKIETVENSTYQELYSSTANLPGENVGFLNDVWLKPKLFRNYRITMRVDRDGDYYLGLTTGSSPTRYIFQYYDVQNDTVQFIINNAIVYRPLTESKENKEVEEKTQEAVDESVNAGSDSSSSASSGGANLLTAITGFFNVITSAQATNCRFNAPLNTYFGNERLNVDLCSLDLPSGIGALTSIIAIGILIPFAIHMFNKFIALFRSFQS